MSKTFAVIGDPISHSLSPNIHSAAFRELNLDCAYIGYRIPKDELEAGIEGLKKIKIEGFNVTIPHKIRIMKYLDKIDESCSLIGAANTIVNVDGNLKGYNTDMDGFLEPFKKKGLEIKNSKILLLGAGGAARAIVAGFAKEKAKSITIANRTIENAIGIGKELDAKVIPLSALSDHLIDTDILIASTASQFPILGKGIVESAIKARRHKPIFMVDLAVPRDIESEVNDLRDVYLYTLDDLQSIINQNQQSREEAASEAEIIIEKAVIDFQETDLSLSVVDTLVKFRRKHEDIKTTELDKALKRLEAGDAAQDVLINFANQLTNKIIHTPSIQMKQAKIEGRDEVLIAISTLFQLNSDES